MTDFKLRSFEYYRQGDRIETLTHSVMIGLLTSPLFIRHSSYSVNFIMFGLNDSLNLFTTGHF